MTGLHVLHNRRVSDGPPKTPCGPPYRVSRRGLPVPLTTSSPPGVTPGLTNDTTDTGQDQGTDRSEYKTLPERDRVVSPPTHTSIHLSTTYPHTHLPIYLLTYPTVYPQSFYPFTYLPIYFWTDSNIDGPTHPPVTLLHIYLPNNP